MSTLVEAVDLAMFPRLFQAAARPAAMLLAHGGVCQGIPSNLWV
jgi:hypothetical protein